MNLTLALKKYSQLEKREKLLKKKIWEYLNTTIWEAVSEHNKSRVSDYRVNGFTYDFSRNAINIELCGLSHRGVRGSKGMVMEETMSAEPEDLNKSIRSFVEKRFSLGKGYGVKVRISSELFGK